MITESHIISLDGPGTEDHRRICLWIIKLKDIIFLYLKPLKTAEGTSIPPQFLSLFLAMTQTIDSKSNSFTSTLLNENQSEHSVEYSTNLGSRLSKRFKSQIYVSNSIQENHFYNNDDDLLTLERNIVEILKR